MIRRKATPAPRMINGIISRPSGCAVCETSAHQLRSISASPVNSTPIPAIRSTQTSRLRIDRLRSKMRLKNWSRCIVDTDRETCSASTVTTSSCALMLCSLSRVAVRSLRDCATPASSFWPAAGAGPSELICCVTSPSGTSSFSERSAAVVRIFSSVILSVARSWSFRFGRRSCIVAASRSMRSCWSARSVSPMIARSRARLAENARHSAMSADSRTRPMRIGLDQPALFDRRRDEG